ncbi:MAG TPA: metallophosphoesterase family protein, partial [Chloroflexota bacterium]|nr:metallophosphoesterase family protein [Chloroflexota bacterium]
MISDTHVPDRCRELPGPLGDIFKGLDLIVHAGDVGDLRVLRDLEAYAPVVAVQGNDEPDQTKSSLPAEMLRVLDG